MKFQCIERAGHTEADGRYLRAMRSGDGVYTGAGLLVHAVAAWGDAGGVERVLVRKVPET